MHKLFHNILFKRNTLLLSKLPFHFSKETTFLTVFNESLIKFHQKKTRDQREREKNTSHAHVSPLTAVSQVGTDNRRERCKGRKQNLFSHGTQPSQTNNREKHGFYVSATASVALRSIPSYRLFRQKEKKWDTIQINKQQQIHTNTLSHN